MSNCKVLHIASSYCIDVDLLLAQLVKRGITVSGRNTRNPIDEYLRVWKVALALVSIPPLSLAQPAKWSRSPSNLVDEDRYMTQNRDTYLLSSGKSELWTASITTAEAMRDVHDLSSCRFSRIPRWSDRLHFCFIWLRDSNNSPQLRVPRQLLCSRKSTYVETLPSTATCCKRAHIIWLKTEKSMIGPANRWLRNPCWVMPNLCLTLTWLDTVRSSRAWNSKSSPSM